MVIATDAPIHALSDPSRAGFSREDFMRKPRESSADRVWKEALESRASRQEAIALVVLLVVVAAMLLMIGV